MSDKPFIFKKFTVSQDKCAMKIGTDAMLLGSFVPTTNVKNIIDIGTGTGVLALMLAQRSEAEIDAIEIDADAYVQAVDNFRNSPWGNRINAIHGPIQDFYPAGLKKYDLIVSNPPFFDKNIRAGKESPKYTNRAQARSFESLDFKDLLHHAVRILDAEGMFYLIIPNQASDTFLGLARELGLYLTHYLDILSRKDQKPVRRIFGFSLVNLPPVSGQLIIRETNGSYTDQYIELTKEYHGISVF